MERIERLYFPFHSALAGLIDETEARFGFAVLIDCHSMPSSAAVAGGGIRPDIVIGDRFRSILRSSPCAHGARSVYARAMTCGDRTAPMPEVT